MASALRRFCCQIPPWIFPTFSPAASFPPRALLPVKPDVAGSLPAFPFRPERFPLPKASTAAAAAKNEGPKWWERNNSPNMIDIHSTEEFLDALSQAGDKLVVVEFYGTWCASCRAMFPKFCRTAKDNADVVFLKVDYDENKPMCERLNVKVVPYFHFYRGAEGKLEAFTCSLPKFQKIKDAIAIHNTARCSIGPPIGVEELDLLAALIQDEILTEADPV